ncbi:hypothetical protein V6N13_092357 [Hibiscus sabdariffa]|uniref:Alpha-carbonic anhydrase domain-containing protein n=1 Tax=Hibiscus sabdariffa TaxID=183260 RepID=A0ABR2CC52_9ROSI
MKFFSITFFCSFIFLSACSRSQTEFNYDEGTGRRPSRWGMLKQKWGKCSTGRQQSPIDLGTVQVDSRSGDLQRNYRSAQAILRNMTEYVTMMFTGDAGSITVSGTVYKVVSCHWHSPSEHTWNGIRYPLEIHIVHRSDQNKTAVVGILYRYGLLPDPFIASIFHAISSLGREDIPLGPINPETIGFPGSSYYRYSGSLTTPPCDENVIWTVLQEVKTVTLHGVGALRNVLPPENRDNSRPTQPLNDRTVLLHLKNFT